MWITFSNYHCSINTSWFCVSFMSDIECTSKVTLKDLLTFVTGAEHIPPLDWGTDKDQFNTFRLYRRVISGLWQITTPCSWNHHRHPRTWALHRLVVQMWNPDGAQEELKAPRKKNQWCQLVPACPSLRRPTRPDLPQRTELCHPVTPPEKSSVGTEPYTSGLTSRVMPPPATPSIQSFILSKHSPTVANSRQSGMLSASSRQCLLRPHLTI